MDAAKFVTDLNRYRQLIAENLPAAEGEDSDASGARSASARVLQVEQGEILAYAVKAPEQLRGDSAAGLIGAATSPGMAQMAVIDVAGHHRPVYRPVLVYSFIQTFRLMYEKLPRADFGKWEEATRAWADVLEGELHQVSWPAEGMPAQRGGGACEAAWAALALHIAGKVFVRDAFTDQAADIFGKLVRGQQASGNFLTPTASDNPETHGYHELVLLHAAASFAAQAEDRVVAAAVKRATEFHQNETQPDHASGQPWGIFAFIWNSETRSVADEMLHAVRTIHPCGVRGVGAILLADAIVCIDQFLQ